MAAAAGARPAPRHQVFPGDGISPSTTERALVAGSVGGRGHAGRTHSPSALVFPWKRSGCAAERHTRAGAGGGSCGGARRSADGPCTARHAAAAAGGGGRDGCVGRRRRRPRRWGLAVAASSNLSPLSTGGRTVRIPWGGRAAEARRPTGYGARWPRRTGEAAAWERPAVGEPLLTQTPPCGPYTRSVAGHEQRSVACACTLAADWARPTRCSCAGGGHRGVRLEREPRERGTEREDNVVVSGSSQWRHPSSVFRRPRGMPRTGLFPIARQARDSSLGRRMSFCTHGKLERRSRKRRIIVNQQTLCAGSGLLKAPNPWMAAAR